MRKNWGRRTAPPKQWLTTSQGYNATATVAAVGLSEFRLADAIVSGSATGIPAIARMTIYRIVGQIGLSAGTLATQVDMGIIVLQSQAGAVALPSPRTAADADARWLWLRHYGLPAAAATNRAYMNDGGATGDGFFGNHVDITVRRKLMPNEVLSLVIAAGQDTVVVYPFLRTLIGRVA